MVSEDFLKPRLTGTRFEGGAIPLQFLADLSAIEKLVVEVAKWKYLQSNPDRKRVPRGFANDITIKLVGVEQGSAIALLKLFVAGAAIHFPAEAHDSFIEARTAIIGAIAAADHGKSITDHLPEKLLWHFDRIGRTLAEGESVEFTDKPDAEPARLTRESRRSLVLASSSVEEVTEEASVYGQISEFNQLKKTCQIQLANGLLLQNVPVEKQHFDTILEAFNSYEKGIKVRVQGDALFSRYNRIQGMGSIEHVTIIDPLDVGARIEELKQLKEGWLEGEGVVPRPVDLDWFARAFADNYPDALPLPYLYPTPEGGLRAEWSLPDFEASLDIPFQGHVAMWHDLDLKTDDEYASKIDLDISAAWESLVTRIRDRFTRGAQ